MDKKLPIKVYNSFLKILISSIFTVIFAGFILSLELLTNTYDLPLLLVAIIFLTLGIWGSFFSFKIRNTPMLIIDSKGLSGYLLRTHRLSPLKKIEKLPWNEIKNLRQEYYSTKGSHFYYLYIDIYHPELFYTKKYNSFRVKYSKLLFWRNVERKLLFKMNKDTLLTLPINNIKDREAVFSQIVKIWKDYSDKNK